MQAARFLCAHFVFIASALFLARLTYSPTTVTMLSTRFAGKREIRFAVLPIQLPGLSHMNSWVARPSIVVLASFCRSVCPFPESVRREWRPQRLNMMMNIILNAGWRAAHHRSGRCIFLFLTAISRFKLSQHGIILLQNRYRRSVIN